jgi:hypothetical protein
MSCSIVKGWRLNGSVFCWCRCRTIVDLSTCFTFGDEGDAQGKREGMSGE